MVRSIRDLFCFSHQQTITKTDPTLATSNNVIRVRPVPETAARARLPTTRVTIPETTRIPIRLLSPAASSELASTPSTCPSTCSSSLAESIVTATSVTSDGSSLTSGELTKLGTIPPQYHGTPYFPIMQLDGSLRPPPISFSGYGSFGGRFVPESIMGFLYELTSVFESAISDPSFWAEYAAFQRTRNTPLQRASKLTDLAGGANIWLKREDQNEYGSHKTRNIVGQLLLARRMGRAEVVADCASAKHGNFTAAMCARLNLRCVVVMGADDAQSQEEDVLEMKMLGAKVLTARTPSGMGTLRAAITEALRYSVCNHETAYYLMGGPVGPTPLPTLTRTFQALLGEEVAAQMHAAMGRQPDALVTAVGSGAGAVGLFRPFLHEPSIRLECVESAGAAALTEGSVGVLQGARTLMLQDDDGQILDSHSISPDMNLSTVGPEVAHWKKSGRVEISTATDADALDGFKTLQRHEGILIGLDSSHAVRRAISLARELGPGKNLILLVTGCDAIGIRELDV
ncbi:Tryptophan synthase [Penicillium cataractarum]|uniref:tryptophan synthase n=1 Tax=Penicillium cataractarum TaxID=2100454 RepID=A0A9W9VF62_9EURO|nr:Tryptophan synthase [Penicillium cataractarum]KAJ5379752.1 Tryptophan synthase [Penicillium cataractarum]